MVLCIERHFPCEFRKGIFVPFYKEERGWEAVAARETPPRPRAKLMCVLVAEYKKNNQQPSTSVSLNESKRNPIDVLSRI